MFWQHAHELKLMFNITHILNAANNPSSESFDVETQTYTRVRDWESAETYTFFRNIVESKDYNVEPYFSLSNMNIGLIKTVVST